MTRGAWWRSAVALTIVGLVMVMARFWPAAPVPSTGPAVPATNGVARLPPGEILESARSALVESHSVRLRGELVDRGTPISLDVRLLAKGDVSGWVQSDGRRFRLISTGGRTYLRGRDALRRWGSADVADYVGDRWVLVPAGRGGPGGFPGAMDLVRFADQTLGPEASTGYVTGPTETVGGRPAVRLDGAHGSWWVALTGPPYPLRLQSRLAIDGPVQQLDFSEFDRDVRIRPPAHPIDLAELG